jgi:hypothetical protein
MMTDLRKAAQQVLKTWDTDDWFDSDTLRAALAQPDPDYAACAMCGGLSVDPILKHPEQTAMGPDIAKVLFDNVESLYIEDAQPEPEQEPMAWLNEENGLLIHRTTHPQNYTPLYRAPPQRKPLTEEEINKLWTQKLDDFCWIRLFARAIENAHGIGVEE